MPVRFLLAVGDGRTHMPEHPVVHAINLDYMPVRTRKVYGAYLLPRCVGGGLGLLVDMTQLDND